VADIGESNHSAPSILDVDTLRRLFQQLDATDVDELEVEIGESRLYLRREPGQRTALVRQTLAKSQERRVETNGIPITAPLAGVFYSRQSPEQLPYVSAGDPIEVGQVVALIETMKLFNEVTSDVAGEVVSVGAEDGESVQAGQVLFVIQPSSAEPES
jgi:acetyl-CoA carboxylase biotin carboxyl carrier protein